MTAENPASRALARASHLLARLRPSRLGLSLPGGWTALVLASLSFLPSLVPRPALYQGLITGLTAAIGYGLGVLGAWVWRELADRELRHPSPCSVRALLVTAPLLLLAALALGVVWQRESSLLLEMEPEHPAAALVTLPVAALVLAVTILGARLLRAAADRLAAALRRIMRPRAARLVGVVALVATVALLVNGVLLEQARVTVNAAFSLTNGGTPEGLGAPTSPLRSGSPASLIDWDTLGFQGRGFVGQGPSAAGIARAAAASGLPAGTALDPIRIYAGLDSAPDTETRATLAVQDLERAGGFERSSLLIVTTTGTGWVEPTSVSAFEHLTLGDSATVSMQYSFLPSPMSFLADQENARNAGRALFDAVYERWRLLPEESRPRLYVFGESLGSYGGEAAFSGEFDMANRVSGAVFTGPPGFNHLFGQVVREREEGSLQIAPVYREGRTVRVTQDPFAPTEPAGRPWEGTRVLYMVHPSDGTTWWNPDMALSRPDWLAEPRERILADRAAEAMYVSPLLQAATLDVVTQPGWSTHRRTVRHQLGARRDALVSALAAVSPELAPEHLPAGGLNLWLRLPESIHVPRLVRDCESRGVLIADGAEWFPAEASAPFVRLNYAADHPDRFPDAAAALRAALAEQAVPSP